MRAAWVSPRAFVGAHRQPRMVCLGVGVEWNRGLGSRTIFVHCLVWTLSVRWYP